MPWPSFSSRPGRGRSGMRFARSILSAGFFVLFGAGGLFFSLALLFPLPRPFARRMLKGSFMLFVWLARVTRLFRVDVSPEDRSRLASLKGAVVVSNHLTLIDVIILFSLTGEAVCVTKESVSRNPFMRAVARSVLIVNDGPLDVLRQAVRHLAGGVNVIVFPEGTRTPADDPTHVFRRGAAHIALRSGAPVEVVRLTCDPPVLGKRQPWWDVGRSTIVYTVRCRGRIDAPPRSGHMRGGSTRLRAVALTAKMHERVFGA